MKYIILDDNEDYSKALFLQLNNYVLPLNEEFNSLKGNNLNELVVNIKTMINGDSEVILLVNINIAVHQKKRQQTYGIDLIKYLRLNGVNNHCVVYSFLDSKSIIKNNPLCSILYSKGVTFIQAPNSVTEFSCDQDELAVRDNLLPFFRAEVDLMKIRHELANIWGLERMKWLLDYKGGNSDRNLTIELLKYLNSKDVRNNNLDKRKLTKLIDWFKANQPTIIYYDDMADLWGPVLKSILGNNFSFYNPARTSVSELIKIIEDSSPKCLLLDLRLENEKERNINPLVFSGGKVLVAIKRNYFSLPVIMYTATNKAESVRRLISAGAEYVWTKEGLDDGINDVYTLENAIDLLDRIKSCVHKFQNETYEKLYEAETKINNTFYIDNKLKEILSRGALKDFKTIIFDSNFLIDAINYKGSLLLIHKILFTNKKLAIDQKDIIIHEDVYNEIFTISKQNENANDENKYRVPVARYLIKLLYNWSKYKLVKTPYNDGQLASIQNISQIDIHNILTPLEQIQLEEKSFFERISDLFQNEQNIQIENYNKKIDEFNEGIKKLPDFKKIRLHADDTFREIIPHYLNKGSVLFITNDNTCAYNVGQTFLNASEIEPHTYNCKFDLKDKNLITEMKGIKSAMIGKNKYKHLFNGEFTRLFY